MVISVVYTLTEKTSHTGDIPYLHQNPYTYHFIFYTLYQISCLYTNEKKQTYKYKLIAYFILYMCKSYGHNMILLFSAFKRALSFKRLFCNFAFSRINIIIIITFFFFFNFAFSRINNNMKSFSLVLSRCTM